MLTLVIMKNSVNLQKNKHKEKITILRNFCAILSHVYFYCITEYHRLFIITIKVTIIRI